MDNKNINTSIPIQFEKIKDDTDNRFTKVKIWLCSVGLTLHNSYFDKTVLEKMKKSLHNIPILGYLQVQNDNTLDMKGHEEEIVISEDGVETRYLGRAFGLIPENSNPQFEIKDDKEWLTCEGLLWNKFSEVIDIFDRDLVKKQSMELLPESVKGYLGKDGIFYFTDCIVEGACILGNNRTPAVPNSVIEKFSVNTIKEQLQEMIMELADTSYINNIEKGGRNNMGNKFELTSQQLTEELNRVLSLNTVKDRWGDNVPAYLYVDHDNNRVYAYDRANRYNVGLNYSMNGDKVEVDYESAKRIKFMPVDLEEGVETEFNFVPKDEVDKFEEKYNTVKTKYENTSQVLDKVQKEKDDFKEKFESINKSISEKDTTLKELTTKFETVTTSYENLKKNYDALLADSEELRKMKYEKFKSEKIDLINDKRFSKLPNDIKEKFISDIDKFEKIESLETDLYIELGKVFSQYSIEEINKNKDTDKEVSVNFEKVDDEVTGYERLIIENRNKKIKK